MPTFQRLPRFDADLRALTPEQRRRFVIAVGQLVDDLRRGEGFRPGLRVKRVQATADVWEVTSAPDGRATWQYGPPRREGEAHVVWRRVGTHDVLRRP